MIAPPKRGNYTSSAFRPIAMSVPRHMGNKFPRAAWGLAIVEAVIGYEWLLSGLDKVLSFKYLSGLAETLRSSIQGNANIWWAGFIQMQVLPHAQTWAMLVEIGELLVALGCFAGALVWASGRFPIDGWTRWLNAGVILALIGGVLMTANYYLMAGHGFPGINPGDPFDEGLSLDGVLTGIGLGLLVMHLLAMRSGGRPVDVPLRQVVPGEKREEGQGL